MISENPYCTTIEARVSSKTVNQLKFWLNLSHWQVQLFWIAFVYLFFNWSFMVPLTGDQKTYLSIALEMKQSGHFLIPQLFGEPNFLKPPLQYWATLLGWFFFGFNLFATYLPGAIAAILTCYLLIRIQQHYFGRKSVGYSALWFAISAGAITYAHSPQMEIFLVLFYSAAWLMGLKFLKSKKFKFLYYALLIVGVLAWIKSPLYSVIWMTSFSLFVLMEKKTWVLKNKNTYFALALGIFVGISWFLIAYQIEPDRFWNQYIITETLSKKGGSAPLWRLWYDFSSFLLPFTFLFIPITIVSFRSSSLTQSQKNFLLSWIVIPAVFFSSFPYKTETYLFLIIPAFCLWIDWVVTRILKRHHKPYFFWIACIFNGILILSITPIVGAILTRAEMIPLWIGWGLTLVGLLSGYLLLRLKIRNFLILQLMTVFLVKASIVSIGEKEIQPLEEIIQTNEIENIDFLDHGKNIWHEIGLISAAVSIPMKRLHSFREVTQSLENGHSVIVSNSEKNQFKKQFSTGLKYIFLEWKRWQRRGVFPVKDLLLYGKHRIKDWNQRFQRSFWIIVSNKKHPLKHKKI